MIDCVFSLIRYNINKKHYYERHGVKEYWIISPNEKAIEVYLLTAAGRLELDNIYTVLDDWYWNAMTAEEKAAAQLSFKLSLYDDLVVNVKEVFDNID